MDVRYYYKDVLIVVSLFHYCSLCWFGCQWKFVHCGCFLQLKLCCRLFRAHGGKLHACKGFLMCSNSLCNDCWLVETTLALCTKVLKTVCFAAIKWLLSQCRYWSVCLGFLNTEVMRVFLGTWRNQGVQKW